MVEVKIEVVEHHHWVIHFIILLKLVLNHHEMVLMDLEDLNNLKENIDQVLKIDMMKQEQQSILIFL